MITVDTFAQAQAERATVMATTLEKRQKGFDRVIDEWRAKCDSLAAELDASQRDGRSMATEVFKLRAQNDEMHEHVGCTDKQLRATLWMIENLQTESMRRENKTLAQEVKDLSDQLSDGGRSVHELQKTARRLELEKEELQLALDEAEATLESQDVKVHRAQVELAQIRQEIEKRIHEKEEEFESTRKNHQRVIDSMQVGATLLPAMNTV
jgi:chromosome segregation ATPase